MWPESDSHRIIHTCICKLMLNFKAIPKKVALFLIIFQKAVNGSLGTAENQMNAIKNHDPLDTNITIIKAISLTAIDSRA